MTDIDTAIAAARCSDRRTTQGYRDHLLCDEIERLQGELSYCRTLLCGDEHEWEPREPDDFWDVPWEICRACGMGRVKSGEGERDLKP